MFDDMPDDPLPCQRIFLSPICALEDIVKVSKSPVCERVLNQLPAIFKSPYQFSSAANGCFGAIPHTQHVNIYAAFAHQTMEPPNACSYNMSGDHANSAKLWRCTQRKLFR